MLGALYTFLCSDCTTAVARDWAAGQQYMKDGTNRSFRTGGYSKVTRNRKGITSITIRLKSRDFRKPRQERSWGGGLSQFKGGKAKINAN